jgi:invasion protein IalB
LRDKTEANQAHNANRINCLTIMVMTLMNASRAQVKEFNPLLSSLSFISTAPGLKALVMMALAVGLFALSGATPGQAQGAVRSVHGEWEIRCDTPPGAPSEQCALMQYVTAADRDNVGLTVIVLNTADQKARILRVLTPLGVLLPHGLGLRIDDTDVGRAGFVRCLPQGCIAEVIMDDKLVKLLSEGKFATFIVFQTPEEGIGIPIPLEGFKTGFAELK